MIVQAPGWGPSGLYLERTLTPLLGLSEVHHYPVRNTPGGASVDVEGSQATAHLVADLDDERQKLGASRVILVGHSHGAVVALGYAAKHPDRVAGLLLLGPSLEGPGATSRGAELLARHASDPLREAAVAAWERNPRDAADSVDDREFARWLRAVAPLNFHDLNALERFQRVMKDAPPPSGKALWGTPKAPEPWIRRGLKDLRAPALGIVGRSDFVTPYDAAADVQELIPGMRLLLLDHAGHNCWLERPKAVARAARDFLGSLAQAVY